MEMDVGSCAQCGGRGSVAEPCTSSACLKKGYHYIPDPHGLALDHGPGVVVDPWLGQRIDEYVLVSVLGKGGFGQVYLALQVPILLKAAMKLLSKDRIPSHREEAILRKFKGEAAALASLNHPNIVRLLKYGAVAKQPYMVVEYIEGGRTLQEGFLLPLSYGEKIALSRIRSVVHQILKALDSAHSRNIIHRDIKPENIMLQRINENPDYVKLLDFGLAKFLEDEGHTTTIMGTPLYMAPEQLFRASVGPWTDLYSVGVIVFEMLTGVWPYEGDTQQEILSCKINADYDPVSRLQGMDLPFEVHGFFELVLARESVDRVQTASEFRFLFDQVIDAIEATGKSHIVAQDILTEERFFRDAGSPARTSSTNDNIQALSASRRSGGRDDEGDAVTGLGVRLILIALLILLCGGVTALAVRHQKRNVNTVAMPEATSSRDVQDARNAPPHRASEDMDLRTLPLWEKGNSWLLQVTRESAGGATDEGAAITFTVRRRITRVRKGEQSVSVDILEHGGLMKPRRKSFNLTKDCIEQTRPKKALWCFSAGGADRNVFGQTTRVYSAQDGHDLIEFSPELGWVTERRSLPRKRRTYVRILSGYDIGGETKGNAKHRPMECSWDARASGGVDVGNTESLDTPEASLAQKNGLDGSITKLEISLSGRHGARTATTLRDESATLIRFPNIPDPSWADGLVVPMPVSKIQAWTVPDGGAEIVSLIFDSTDLRSVHFIILRLQHGVVEGKAFEVRRDDPRFGLDAQGSSSFQVLLASGAETCSIQLQRRMGPYGTLGSYIHELAVTGDEIRFVRGTLSPVATDFPNR
jgi:serine/threonine protein kinase